MDTVTWVQIPVKAAYISHSANTIVKSMNPIIHSPAMGKAVGLTRLFDRGMTTGIGEGKHWIQTW